MNERIKKLRKILGLTQQEFGDRIGIKRNSVALIESGRNTSEQTIFSICREFNVNEEWLKTGEGEMFKETSNSALDALVQEYDLSDTEYALIKKFVNLKPSARKAVFAYVQEIVNALKSDDVAPSAPAMPKEPLSKMTVEQLEEEYKKSRSASASKRNSSVSNITEGNERKEANN